MGVTEVIYVGALLLICFTAYSVLTLLVDFNEENNSFHNEEIVIADEPLSEIKDKRVVSGSSLFNDEEDIVIQEFDDDGEKTGSVSNSSDVKLLT